MHEEMEWISTLRCHGDDIVCVLIDSMSFGYVLFRLLWKKHEKSKLVTTSLTLRLLMSYIYIYIYIYMEHQFFMFLDHTQRRTTVGRTTLDEWSARRRDLYLTTHDTHNRQISMPPVGFEPTISAGERPRPEESYRLWCVVVCDLETSRIGAPYIYMTLVA